MQKRTLVFSGMVCLLLLVILSWLLTSRPSAIFPTPTPFPTATPWPMAYRFASPDYGMNLHIWWDPWAAIRRDWALVQQADFTWVKQRLAWQDVEGDGPGRYVWAGSDRIVDEAKQAGLNLIFRVDYPPAWAIPTATENTLPVDIAAFGNFCHALAARYAGRVGGYQVWNEPNLAREWNGLPPHPEGYVQVLRACYIGIKTADPHALVISAGLSPTGTGLPEAYPDTAYLTEMYAAGAAPYFDLLGLNAPGYKAPPETSPAQAADPVNDYGGQRFFCFRHVEDMRAIMEARGDAHKQVAILEFGWHTNNSPEHPEYAWFAVTPEQQGDYLVRAFRYAQAHWAPWIGPMFVWNIPDSKWETQHEEFWWGIADPFWWGFDGNYETWGGSATRPAYEALKQMEKDAVP